MKVFYVLVVLIAILVALFAVPPMLSAQDTATVLCGFLTLVVAVGCSLGSLIKLVDGGK